MPKPTISRERRAQLKSMARYAAAGLVENTEACLMGGFENLPMHEMELIEAEFQAIGRRIYKETSHDD